MNDFCRSISPDTLQSYGSLREFLVQSNAQWSEQALLSAGAPMSSLAAGEANTHDTTIDPAAAQCLHDLIQSSGNPQLIAELSRTETLLSQAQAGENLNAVQTEQLFTYLSLTHYVSHDTPVSEHNLLDLGIGLGLGVGLTTLVVLGLREMRRTRQSSTSVAPPPLSVSTEPATVDPASVLPGDTGERRISFEWREDSPIQRFDITLAATSDERRFAGNTFVENTSFELVRGDNDQLLVRRSYREDHSIEPMIYREGQVYSLPESAWVELGEHDVLVQIHIGSADNQENGTLRVEQAVRIARHENGGAFIPVDLDSVDKNLCVELDPVALTEVPLSVQQHVMEISYARTVFEAARISTLPQSGQLLSTSERAAAMHAWNDLGEGAQQHFLERSGIDSSGYRAEMPVSFVRDYLTHRSSALILEDFSLRASHNPNILGAVMAQRLQIEAGFGSYGVESQAETGSQTVEGRLNLSFRNAEDRFLLNADADSLVSTGIREESQAEIHMDAAGRFRVRGTQQQGARLYRVNDSLQWNYTELPEGFESAPALREGDVLRVGENSFRVHTGSGQVLLTPLSGAADLAAATESHFEAPVVHEHLDPQWVRSMRSQVEHFDEYLRTATTEGQRVPDSVSDAIRRLQTHIADRRPVMPGSHDAHVIALAEEFLPAMAVEDGEILSSEPNMFAGFDAERDSVGFEEEITQVRDKSELMAEHERMMRERRTGYAERIAVLEAGLGYAEPASQDYRTISDAIDALRDAHGLTGDDPREIDPDAAVHISAAESLVAILSESSLDQELEGVRVLQEKVREMLRYEPEGEVRDRLSEVNEIAKGALREQRGLQPHEQAVVHRMRQFVDTLMGSDVYERFRDTSRSLRENHLSPERRAQFEQELPRQTQAYTDFRDSTVLNHPFLFDIVEDERPTVVPPPPLPNAAAETPAVAPAVLTPVETARAQRGQIAPLLTLVPDTNPARGILTRADQYLFEVQDGRRESLSPVQARMVTMAMDLVTRFEGSTSYQDVRRINSQIQSLQASGTTSDSQVSRLETDRAPFEAAFVQEADQMARQVLPMELFSSAEQTPVTPQSIALEIVDRWPQLEGRLYEGAVTEMANQIHGVWERRGRPGSSGPGAIAGLPSERFVEAAMNMMLEGYEQRSNTMSRLAESIRRSDRGPRAERDTTSLARRIVEASRRSVAIGGRR